MASTETHDDGRPSVLASISREMVRVYKDQFGRGPTKTRTDWANSDMLVCTLENTLRPTKRKIIELGRHQQVRDTRTFFQYASMREFCEPSASPGERCTPSSSAIDTNASGLAMETFIFHSRGT